MATEFMTLAGQRSFDSSGRVAPSNSTLTLAPSQLTYKRGHYVKNKSQLLNVPNTTIEVAVRITIKAVPLVCAYNSTICAHLSRPLTTCQWLHVACEMIVVSVLVQVLSVL